MNEYYCEEKEPQKLYRIGMFSQLNRVTIKTLRYYDDIGLLKPEYVDEVNGYRYYTSAQLPLLHRILAMKEMNFKIEEIRQVLAGVSEEKLLLKKKNELLYSIAEASKKLAAIESYLHGDYLQSEYRILMKSLPEVIVAGMQVHMSGYEQLFEKMPEMGALLEQMECECADPDYCFTIYYDEEYRESDIHAEICQAVTSVKETCGPVTCKVLPAIEHAACVYHKGPYRELPKAYAAIVSFIEESGYEIIGHQRESYIDGVWNKDSEEDWLTEIQFPVRKL